MRRVMKGYESEGLPLHSLRECVAIYEEAASWRRPPGYPRARVVAIAVNTGMLIGGNVTPESLIGDAARTTGLPAADPVREGAAGADRLAKAILDNEAAP